MRYTFPQTIEDFQAATRLVLKRQSWRRPFIVAIIVFGAVMVLLPLLNRRPPSWQYIVLDGAPWVFIALLWMALLTGTYTWMFVVIMALGLAALFAIALIGHHQSIGDSIANLLPYVIMAALVPLVPYFMKRMFRTNALYQGDMTVELGAEELRVIRSASTMSFRWSSIARATETPEYFLIYVMKGSAFYIPKRVIPPGDLDDLRAFLRAHVPSGML